MVRPRKLVITKESLEEFLNKGLSYREIANEVFQRYGVKVNRSTVYRLAQRYGIKNLNIHKQYKEYLKRRKKPIERLNPELATKANCYMDITEISFRSQIGKHKRSIKRYFVSLKVNQKLYLYFIKNQKKSSILEALIHLRKFMPKNPICLVDTQLNPKLPDRSEITFCNTTEWHPIRNLVEKHHGFKTAIYAKYWKFKGIAYSKMDEYQKILLLKLYLETIERNQNIEIINKDELVKEICQLAKANQL